MEMTEEEIERSYRQAHNPHKQITVLAQLNECSTDQIKDILIDRGVLGQLKKRKKPGPKTRSTVNTKKGLISYADMQKMTNMISEQDVKEIEKIVESKHNKKKIPDAVEKTLRNRIEDLDKLIYGTKLNIETFNLKLEEYQREYVELTDYLA